jgi:hypothetical protein
MELAVRREGWSKFAALCWLSLDNALSEKRVDGRPVIVDGDP